MVHALEEIRRVLVPGGVLLDLRPLSVNSPVEVVAGERVMQVGRLDEPPGDPDDVAANEAMAHVERAGWFARERQGSFELAYEWDTPDEMKAYIDERWATGKLPESVWMAARRLTATAGAGAKVRVLRRMVIARWRKRQT
jgi:hypothetical protein